MRSLTLKGYILARNLKCVLPGYLRDSAACQAAFLALIIIITTTTAAAAEGHIFPHLRTVLLQTD